MRSAWEHDTDYQSSSLGDLVGAPRALSAGLQLLQSSWCDKWICNKNAASWTMHERELVPGNPDNSSWHPYVNERDDLCNQEFNEAGCANRHIFLTTSVSILSSSICKFCSEWFWPGPAAFGNHLLCEQRLPFESLARDSSLHR